jgi:hypothetical protein
MTLTFMGLLDSSTYLVLSKSSIQKDYNAKAAFSKVLENNYQVWPDVLWWMPTLQRDIQYIVPTDIIISSHSVWNAGSKIRTYNVYLG